MGFKVPSQSEFFFLSFRVLLFILYIMLRVFSRRHRRDILTGVKSFLIRGIGGFPGGAVVKNLPANAGDTGSSPGPGRSHMPRSS